MPDGVAGRRSMKRAEKIVRTQPLMEADVAVIFLKTSKNMLYRALNEGSIKGIRIGSKWRIPTAPYRALLSPEFIKADDEDNKAA